MDYLTAWREGHEAGMSLSVKIINELCETDFDKASDVVLYIKQLEGDTDFKFVERVVPKPEPKPEPKKEEQPKDEVTVKDRKFIAELSREIAMQNWMWKD